MISASMIFVSINLFWVIHLGNEAKRSKKTLNQPQPSIPVLDFGTIQNNPTTISLIRNDHKDGAPPLAHFLLSANGNRVQIFVNGLNSLTALTVLFTRYSLVLQCIVAVAYKKVSSSTTFIRPLCSLQSVAKVRHKSVLIFFGNRTFFSSFYFR